MRDADTYLSDASRQLDERIYSMSLAGKGRAEIAVELDMNAEAVSLRLHRLGVKFQLPEAIRDAILDRHEEGWRPSRIARQVGVIQPVVERVISRAGLTPNAAPAANQSVRQPAKASVGAAEPGRRITWTPALDDLVRRLADVGSSAAQIGIVCGVSEAAAATRMSRLGVRTRDTRRAA